MMMRVFKLSALLFFVFLVLQNGEVFSQGRTVPERKVQLFDRTELYFGRSKPDGTVVTVSEWQDFLQKIVSPRFPGGFTVLSGSGQFRGSDGKIIAEPSELIIIMYPAGSKKVSRILIEEIRAAYLQEFSQQSVLRMDLKGRVRVWN